MNKIIFNLIIILLITPPTFGDIISYSTYEFDGYDFFLSTEITPAQSSLQDFVGDFIERKIKNGEIHETGRINCTNTENNCHNKGIELTKGKEELSLYILQNYKEQLFKIALWSYVLYFFTIFISIFLFIGTIKGLIFGNFKKYKITLVILPISILLIDAYVFYLKIHPLFFVVGFSIFSYVITYFFFIIFYILFDIYLSRKNHK